MRDPDKSYMILRDWQTLASQPPKTRRDPQDPQQAKQYIQNVPKFRNAQNSTKLEPRLGKTWQNQLLRHTQPASVSPQPASSATLQKGAVLLSLGNVVARVTAEARLKKRQDFSKTWGRSIYGSLGKSLRPCDSCITLYL